MPARSILCLFLTATCLLASAITSAADWSQFLGPQFGVTQETGIPLKWDADHVAWKTALEGRGASSPVTFGDRVYLTCYTGYGIDSDQPGDPKDLKRHLVCLNSEDGEIQWTKTVDSTSPKNPFTPWATKLHGFASSTPAVDKTGIYVFFGATGVFAFDHDGNLRWGTNCGTGTHMFGAGNSPILFQDLVIVNASVESKDLIALKKTDGKEVWRQSGIDESWNTPAIYQTAQGSTELALSIKGSILAFEPETGQRLWNCDGISDYICPSIVAVDGTLFASGGRSSKMIAVRAGGTGNVTDTHTIWTLSNGSNVSSPVYHDGYLYWAKEKDGVVYCADARTGEKVYAERLKPDPGLIYASPLLANGRLYYVSRQNGTYVVAAKPEFEQMTHCTMAGDDGIFNASPVPLDGGDVLLRSDRFLYRLGVN